MRKYTPDTHCVSLSSVPFHETVMLARRKLARVHQRRDVSTVRVVNDNGRDSVRRQLVTNRGLRVERIGITGNRGGNDRSVISHRGGGRRGKFGEITVGAIRRARWYSQEQVPVVLTAEITSLFESTARPTL